MKHINAESVKAQYPLPIKTTTEFLEELFKDMGYDW
jgi:hypothetical protein